MCLCCPETFPLIASQRDHLVIIHLKIHLISDTSAATVCGCYDEGIAVLDEPDMGLADTDDEEHITCLLFASQRHFVHYIGSIFELIDHELVIDIYYTRFSRFRIP